MLLCGKEITLSIITFNFYLEKQSVCLHYAVMWIRNIANYYRIMYGCMGKPTGM
jgi:hypothetical protein